MAKDWIGTGEGLFKIIGASNHTEKERQSEDYYATEPRAAELLLQNEELHNVWEPACGGGHLAEVFRSHGCLGRASDLVDRCEGKYEVGDFLAMENTAWEGDIVTNPPYKFAQEFIEKALSIVPEGAKVCMFLKLTFLEGKGRKDLFLRFPLKRLYVSSSRLNCAMNGDFKTYKYNSAVAYGWYVWEKGYRGDTVIKWIN